MVPHYYWKDLAKRTAEILDKIASEKPEYKPMIARIVKAVEKKAYDLAEFILIDLLLKASFDMDLPEDLREDITKLMIDFI